MEQGREPKRRGGYRPWAEEDAIVDQIVQGVLNEVCEYFDVDDEDRPA
jgi:predicted Zn-dependent protease with MMP-like domain